MVLSRLRLRKAGHWIVLLLLLLLIAACRTERPAAEGLFSLQVERTDDSTLSLSSLANNKATVFVFLAPDCPLSQNYTLTLNELQRQFVAESVVFYGVVSGNWFDDAAIDSFAATYKIAFPLLRDPDFHLTRALGAAVTPEAFVIDSRGESVYGGAIDNWASDLSRRRTIITEHYLKDALTHHLLGEPPPIPRTQAIGCFIETTDRL
jgi:peroxiredoxin